MKCALRQGYLNDLPLQRVHPIFQREVHAYLDHRLFFHLEGVSITLRLYLGERFLNTAVELQLRYIMVVAVSRGL